MPAAIAGAAQAERYVMITHAHGTDPFGPVVEKGDRDAAAVVGVEFAGTFAATGGMADMARLIEAGSAAQSDGIMGSVPDPDALGNAIRAASESGFPVITINSGLKASAAVGAVMHIGPPEGLAGEAAGERAKEGHFAWLARRPETGTFPVIISVIVAIGFAGNGNAVNPPGPTSNLSVISRFGIIATGACLLMIAGDGDLSIGFAGMSIAMMPNWGLPFGLGPATPLAAFAMPLAMTLFAARRVFKTNTADAARAISRSTKPSRSRRSAGR